MDTLTVANQITALASQHHWWIRLLGISSPIVEPVYKNGWWLIPEDQDNKTIIPSRAIGRVEEYRKAGIPIERVIIAHEAPKLLAAPQVQKKPIVIPWKEIGTDMATAAGILVSVMGAMLVATLPMMLMLPLALIDPAVLIQLPDGTIWEVYSWLP